MENFLLTLSGNYIIQLPGDPCSGVDMCPFNLMFIFIKTIIIFIVLAMIVNHFKAKNIRKRKNNKAAKFAKSKAEELLEGAIKK